MRRFSEEVKELFKPFKFKKMSWWQKFFWEVCFMCETQFKKEEGWCTDVLINEGGGGTRVFCCKRCCDDPKKVQDEYIERRQSYQTLKEVLS